MSERQKALFWSLLLAGAGGCAFYFLIPCACGAECEGGGLRGLSLGITGFTLIILSLGYSLRKQFPRLMLLPLEQWLYFHVVAGTLSLVFITAHSGFHLRNRPAAIAFFFLTLVVLSGAVGLFIVYFMPRSMARKEIAVLIPDDLLLRLSRLSDEIVDLCTKKGGVFLTMFNELAVPLFRTQVGEEPPTADVSPWAGQVSPEDMEDLATLAARLEEAHDLLVLLGKHMKFRWAIKGWLLLHIPSTIGLMVFSLVHIISAVWYGAR